MNFEITLNFSVDVEEFLSSCVINEWLPAFFVAEVEINEDGRIRLLLVSPNVFGANDGPDFFERAEWVAVQLSNAASAVLGRLAKNITLTGFWIPHLHKVLIVHVHYVPAIAFRNRLPIDNIGTITRFVVFSFLFTAMEINIVEVITKKYGMLFGAAHAKMQELLTQQGDILHFLE